MTRLCKVFHLLIHLNSPTQLNLIRDIILKDITGQKFCRLTAIELDTPRITPKGRKLVYWRCSCSCGGSGSYEVSGLRSGKALCCGCVPSEYIYSNLNTQAECFLHKATLVHGDFYDYSKTTYTHSKIRVTVTCRTHGDFLVNPANHLCGTGCKWCSVDRKKVGIDSFIEKSKAKFGDSVSYSKAVYLSTSKPITLTCKIHGDFVSTPANHLKGVAPCPKCSLLARTTETSEFIRKAKAVHGDIYDYSLTTFIRCTEPVQITCKVHGVFNKRPDRFLQGIGCNACSGERRATKQHWNYLKRCDINPLLQNRQGYFYLLKMWDEDEAFIKVGVSKEYKKRLTRYTEQGLNFEILKVITFDTTRESAVFEKEVLDYIRDSNFKHIPFNKFKGWTECAGLEFQNKIVEFIDKGARYE